MEYRELGNSNLRISRIGFGCMSLNGDQHQDSLIQEAIELGINYFDTADLYDKGMNEVWLGKAVKNNREKVYIATKVGNQWRADGSGWDWNPKKEYILNAVDESLKRLQSDYIDLYQLHGGTIDDPIEETIEAFEILKQKGKIRNYGISSIRPNVIRAYVQQSNIASIMMQYSLVDRRPEETALPLLQEKNIGVVARGTVAGGLLVNKPAKPYLNYTAEQIAIAASAIRNITPPGISPATTAIRFALKNSAITAAIVGIRTREQLKEAVAAGNEPALTDEEWQNLKLVVAANTYTEHR